MCKISRHCRHRPQAASALSSEGRLAAVPSSAQTPTPAGAARPVIGDPRHHVVGVMNPLSSLISKREGQGVGNFV
jgi:hypothetical protein